jgi:hypothetical protein
MHDDSLVLNMPPDWKPSPRAVSAIARLLLDQARADAAAFDRALAVVGDDPEWAALGVAILAQMNVDPATDFHAPATFARLCEAAARVEVTPAVMAGWKARLRHAAGYGSEASSEGMRNV